MANRLPKGITQRGSRFRVSIMVAGVRMTATCDTLVDAIQKADAMRLGVDTGQVQKAAPWTLQEAVDALMAERVEVNATSAQSIVTRQTTLNRLLAFFGAEASVDDIGYSRIMALSNHLRVQVGYSPSYCNGILVGLKMVLDHAWLSGRKTEAPIKIDLVKRKAGRIRFLTREEEQAVIEWLDHHGLDDMRDTVSLLIDTGLRVGELVALEWKDVDFKAQRIHVWKSKSADPRAVAMTEPVRKILLRRKMANPHPRVMGGMTYKHARLTWQRLRAGIGKDHDRDFVIHALRHTCCTRLVSAGIDLRTVQKWMGHEDIKTTMRYAHFVPENMFNAASALDQDREADRKKPDLRLVKDGDEE